MIIKDFEFSIREFAGSLADFGTLFPFTVGYIVICGFNTTDVLLGIGLTNIILALIYMLPLPVKPQKLLSQLHLLNDGQELATVFKMAVGFIGGLILYFTLETKIIPITKFHHFSNLLLVASTKPKVPLIITSPPGVAK